MIANTRITSLIAGGLNLLNGVGAWLAPLGLRLLLAKEFWDSGLEKWNGMNWFGEIMAMMPFPFNVVPVDISWTISTWSEVAGAIALVLGLGTRFFSFQLIIITLVAWASVHAGLGYNVCDNGWKLPLIYLVMFLPLLLTGPGKLSLDHLIKGWFLGGARS